MSSTATKTWYRPGLVFKAHEKAQGHEECCFSGTPEIRNTDGSLQREAIRPLWAEFGVYGNQYTYEDPQTLATETGSEFRGGYFNLDEQAREKGWSEHEKEIVARHMIRLAEAGRAQFTLYSKPAIGKPWPKYDEAHHKSIPSLAEQLGLVAEALAYEKENKARGEVVAKLEELLAQPAPEAVEELTAA